ncbi:hypothetical protein [Noviherbaspirillum sp.]|uniref:hypothetical protein n=1 Tax=Noviherbaspirillum sp. TaxID=1926288 RepID=UPI002B4782DB|nr:hypothetical protein [Noviherbaspirillum sp.]HJV81327.1 hypothetical protein [Noviherbaspirillum sp.]
MNGRFTASQAMEDLGISLDNNDAHPHFTFHPSGKHHQKPIVNAPGQQSHLPRFDLRHLTDLQEVVKHILATPDAYPVENPKDKFCATITGAYTTHQVTELTFHVSPVDLKSGRILDKDIIPNATARVMCTQPSLPQSVLIQVVHAMVDRPDTGNMHVMAIPVTAET